MLPLRAGQNYRFVKTGESELQCINYKVQFSSRWQNSIVIVIRLSLCINTFKMTFRKLFTSYWRNVLKPSCRLPVSLPGVKTLCLTKLNIRRGTRNRRIFLVYNYRFLQNDFTGEYTTVSCVTESICKLLLRRVPLFLIHNFEFLEEKWRLSRLG